MSAEDFDHRISARIQSVYPPGIQYCVWHGTERILRQPKNYGVVIAEGGFATLSDQLVQTHGQAKQDEGYGDQGKPRLEEL